ncbi:MAG: hypothetical protein ACC657_09795 [Thiohalomonadales bacterium]
MTKLMNSKVLVMLLISLTLINTSNTVYANECMSYIQNKTITINGLKICESAYNGISDIYSCQDYQSADRNYRVLYKGGIVPKAIVVLNEQQQEKIIWATIFGDKKLHCPLIAPRGIHINAKHRGTGICTNDHDQFVPCSVYEHKVSRQIDSHRYLVFYPTNETNTNLIKVETYIFDATEDAMTAEIAYQFGLSLLDTECCSQQAMTYLEYAYHLYPKANKYSKAYNNAKFDLSINEAQNNQDK